MPRAVWMPTGPHDDGGYWIELYDPNRRDGLSSFPATEGPFPTEGAARERVARLNGDLPPVRQPFKTAKFGLAAVFSYLIAFAMLWLVRLVTVRVWNLWFNVPILALVGPLLLMRKSWPSWKIDRSLKKNPRYMAHLQACKLCFKVEPYLYQPCPVGMGLMEDAPAGGRQVTTPRPHIESGETTSSDDQRRTEEPDRHGAIVTRESLARLVRTGQEQSLNRRADWRVRDGRTYIEQDWSTETESVEVRDDREYALVPTLLHHHRVGQEIDPHWRCDLYVLDGNRFERQQIVLDVFVSDFEQLPELATDASDG